MKPNFAITSLGAFYQMRSAELNSAQKSGIKNR